MSQIKEFPEADLQQWSDRLRRELKAPHTIESLQWQASEFFKLDPLYDANILSSENLEYLKTFHNQWKAHKIKERPDILAFADLIAGDVSQIKLAEGYHLQSWYSENYMSEVFSLPISTRNLSPNQSQFEGFSEFDPLMNGLAIGKWNSVDFKNMAEQNIHIHAADVHNAGGSAVQELATTLLAAEAYKIQLEGNVDWTNSAVIHLGIGPLFWIELAKVRAMRLLFINFCHVNGLTVKAGNIRTETSKLYWSKTDSELNLIRHTSEVMSSIFGGADQILVFPHTFEKEKALDATRLAINIPLLAFEESQLHTQFDPASGSYMLEILTHKLAQSAWKLFSEWNGIGFEKMVKENRLQNEIGKSAQLLKNRFRDGEVQIVGVNSFQSPMAKTSPAFPVYAPIENPDFQPLVPVFLDV